MAIESMTILDETLVCWCFNVDIFFLKLANWENWKGNLTLLSWIIIKQILLICKHWLTRIQPQHNKCEKCGFFFPFFTVSEIGMLGTTVVRLHACVPRVQPQKQCQPWEDKTPRRINLSGLSLPRHAQERFTLPPSTSSRSTLFQAKSLYHIGCKSWRHFCSIEDNPHTLTF